MVPLALSHADPAATAWFERLRARLHAVPSRGWEQGGLQLQEAAVLAPLFWRGGEPWTLLTRRPLTLRKHPGQVAFPGGSRDPGDLTPLHTALRETHEELGLPAERVTVLGQLGAMPTITGYWVTPFVGVVPADFAWAPNPVEIDRVLEAPLWRLRRERRHVYQADRDAFVWDDDVDFVWGATYRWLDQLVAHVEAVGRPGAAGW